MKKVLLLICCLGMFAAARAQQPALIPQPQKVEWGNGTYTIPSSALYVTSSTKSLEPTARYLREFLQGGKVNLSLSRSLSKGSYTLKITSSGIDIQGGDVEGIANGIATLRQMSLQCGKSLPLVTITDQPRFAWRGFHLDCSRHFFTKQEVERIIDMMALYKLNRFHWHLTDDQGWRIEIKKYPLLTERGAWRIYNNQDTTCLKRAAAEKNPDLMVPKDRYKVVNGDTLYGGYYTQDDIREVVAYARQRGIEIVPEIDMPGHFLSAIDNYEGLSCFQKTGWGEFFTTPLCPGKDKTLQFCKDIWNEVVQLFPYEYVHIGGDEVRKDTWKECPDCQRRIRNQKLKDEFELQAWFLHQMEAHINKLGKRMMGWDEILEGGLSKTATVTWWRTWAPDAPNRVTAHGNNVIYCPEAPFYFSQKPEKYSMRDIYNYELQPASMTAKQRRHVLGVQGNLWGEYIPTLDRAFYQYFPRIFALSELGWSQPQQKDFADFQRRLPAHYNMLHQLGVRYRTPDVSGFYGSNAFTGNTTLTVNCDDPSATIRYTTDGSIPNIQSACYTAPVTIDETTHFALRAFHPDGKADETVHAEFVRQGLLEPQRVQHQTQQGLNAAWYEFGDEGCTKILQSPFKGNYPISDVCIPEGVSGKIGLVVTGYLNVPADGVYTFSLMSDDGSYLKLDGNMVVDNDRPQSPHEEIGQQALKAGLHKLELRYYDHNGGMLRLWVFDAQGNRLSPEKIYCR